MGIGGYGMGYGFMGGGILPMILMVLFWAFVAAAAFFLIRWVLETVNRSGDSAQTARTPDALDVAKLRFARGEITRDEFIAIKQELI